MSDSKAQMSPAQRIAARLRNSGEGSGAAQSVSHGTGPTRTHTNLHEKGTNKPHGSGGGAAPGPLSDGKGERE